MKSFRYLPGVSTLSLNAAVCVGCGMCEMVCPHAVLKIDQRKAGFLRMEEKGQNKHPHVGIKNGGDDPVLPVHVFGYRLQQHDPPPQVAASLPLIQV